MIYATQYRTLRIGKYETTRSSRRTWVFRGVSSYCSSSDICRDTLFINHVICHDCGKDREGRRTSGAYWW
jgi:hypothetical protein